MVQALSQLLGESLCWFAFVPHATVGSGASGLGPRFTANNRGDFGKADRPESAEDVIVKNSWVSSKLCSGVVTVGQFHRTPSDKTNTRSRSTGTSTKYDLNNT